MASITDWINKLTGKSALDIKKVNEQVEQSGTKSENPIEQDFQKLTSSVKKVSGKLKEKVEPTISKQTEKATSALDSAKNIAKKSDVKKIIMIFAAVVVLFVVSIALVKVAPVLKNRNKNQPAEVQEPTPTPVTFDTYQPSIYADDPEVLKLEEDISIFEREVSTVNLRYSGLFPPTLDFNIKF